MNQPRPSESPEDNRQFVHFWYAKYEQGVDLTGNEEAHADLVLVLETLIDNDILYRTLIPLLIVIDIPLPRSCEVFQGEVNRNDLNEDQAELLVITIRLICRPDNYKLEKLFEKFPHLQVH